MRLHFLSGETVTSHGCIEPDKDSIREEPYSLPQGFSWDTLDLGSPAVVSVYTHTRSRNGMKNDPRNTNNQWMQTLDIKNELCTNTLKCLLTFVIFNLAEGALHASK